MGELKPCPFCGKEVDMGREFMAWSVFCVDCGVVGFSSPVRDIAISKWNTRPIEDALQSRIAELTMPDDVREILLEACRSARSEADGLAITYQAYDKRLRYIEESKQYSHALDWLQKGAK